MAGQKTREVRNAPQPHVDKIGGEIELPKEPPRIHKGGSVDVLQAPEVTKKRTATNEDFLAVRWHQAQDVANGLRRQLIDKEQEIINLRVGNARLLARITTLEIEQSEREMDDLRKDHGFELGKSIFKDPKTGEVTWI